MRILQICNKPPFPPRDGGSIAIYNLALSFQKSGNHVTIVTINTDKHFLSEEDFITLNKTIKTYKFYIDTKIKIGGIIKNLLFSSQPYTSTRFISKSFAGFLQKIINDHKFDIIQLEGLYLIPYIDLIKRTTNVPVVLRAHNIEHEIWQRIYSNENNLIKKLYYGILARRIKQFELRSINKYDLLLPITNRDLKKFNDMGNNKNAFVCPAGINVNEDYKVQKNHSSISIYFLGSLDWLPNQEGLKWFVSEVFLPLRKEIPTLIFNIAGRNAPNKLIKIFDRDGIIFHGEVPDSSEFSEKHNVLVAPCFSGSGMRLKIIEAMATGKVVITTTIGAEGLDITNNKDILIADNAIDFKDYIRRLLKHPELCEEIGVHAFNLVNEKYNNSRLAKNLVEFYLNNI